MAKGSGGGGRYGGRGGGKTGLRELAKGLRYGPSMSPSASSLQVGDTIATDRGSGGRVSKIGRTNVTLETTYMGNPMTLKRPLAEFRGGYLRRGKIVHPLNG